MATDSTVDTFLAKYNDYKIKAIYIYIYLHINTADVYTFYRTPSLKGPESLKSFITCFTCRGKKSQYVNYFRIT